MTNYQLYRTNVALSGQMKYDLILESTQNSLYVCNFHITPISDHVPYTYKSDEYIIKNTHQDNIKNYHSIIEGNFFNECLDSKFMHSWPVLCEENQVINTYSDIYDMGCKRSQHFNVYNKQFEILCPLWLEHINGTLKFKIDIKNAISGSILASNTLSFDIKPNIAFHNAFVNYITKYFNDAGLASGNDDVININFKQNTANITGLNVNSGIFESKNIIDLTRNITSIERPLMEVDNMILQSFKDNNLICKQLFNFNLCFNMEDIFSAQIVKMLYGEKVIVSISTFIDDNQLEIKDFYTEYDFIDKYIKTNDNTEYSKNVLDYLNDNNYIDFVNKNKFCQSICHWSLCENPEYLFNVYDGFSGLYIYNNDGDSIIYENLHQYKDAPNTTLKKYNYSNNAGNWLTIERINAWNDFYKYIINTNIEKLHTTYIDGKHNYIHNIKYNYIPQYEDGLYMIGLCIPNSLLSVIIGNKLGLTALCDNGLYLLVKDNLLLFITDNNDNLTFRSFFDYLTQYIKDNSIQTESQKYLLELYKMMSSKVDATLIIFDNCLRFTTAAGPDNTITEIEYVKETNRDLNYVVRYDGKIKPYFTDEVSTLYYKDYISDSNSASKLRKSNYAKYSTLSYEPLYPSIAYCAIKKLTDYDFNTYPLITVSEHESPVYISNQYEYKWFNSSHCIILNNNIRFKYTKYKGDTKDLDTIINEKIQEYYKSDIDTTLFIKSQYQIDTNWEYLTNTSIDDYVYDISLNLKIYM